MMKINNTEKVEMVDDEEVRIPAYKNLGDVSVRSDAPRTLQEIL